MEIESLAEKVRMAKEAVESLEEPLKTEAFKKILDKMLEEEVPKRSKRIEGKTSKSKEGGLHEANKRLKEESESRKRNLAAKVNRTEHVEIHELSNILKKSLYILKILKDKDQDGLTSPEISFILKEVFREKVSQAAVGMALKDAHKYVDRSKITIGTATAYVYRLMKPGEDYLESELEDKSQE